MRLSETFAVPDRLALLYDFVNTLDQRRYIEHGTPHVGGDEIATAKQLETWLCEHDLLEVGRTIEPDDHLDAIALRTALRELLGLNPADRTREIAVGEQLTQVAVKFPLVVKMQVGKGLVLEAAGVSSVRNLAAVLAELQTLDYQGDLDRVKTCASEECGWIFYDRSKPASRRWCSSARCGNRAKTKNYRNRQKKT